MKRRFAAISLALLFILPLSRYAMADSITATEAVEMIWDILRGDYSEIVTDCSASYNENYITLYAKKDGLGAALNLAADSGWDETYPVWVEYKQDFLDMYKSITEMFKANGRSDLKLSIWLENDMKDTGKRCRWGNYLMYTTDGEWIDDMALGRDPWYSESPDVSTLPEKVQPVYTELVRLLRDEVGFEYVCIYYNETDKRFLIDVAYPDIGESLYQAKKSGNTYVYSQWGEMKATLDMVYEALVLYLESAGLSDHEIHFALVNDELYIRDYRDRIDFDPLYAIYPTIIFGERYTNDIME